MQAGGPLVGVLMSVWLSWWANRDVELDPSEPIIWALCDGDETWWDDDISNGINIETLSSQSDMTRSNHHITNPNIVNCQPIRQTSNIKVYVFKRICKFAVSLTIFESNLRNEDPYKLFSICFDSCLITAIDEGNALMGLEVQIQTGGV